MKPINKEIDYKYNLKLYWDALKKYKTHIILMLFLILLIESLNTVDRYLFKIIIDNGNLYFANNILKETFISILVAVAIAYMIFLISRAIARWFSLHLINDFEGKIIFDIKKKFIDHIIKLSYNFHVTHKTGSLISKIGRSGSAVERITDVFLFNFIPLIFQTAIVIGSVIYFNLTSAIVITTTAILFVAFCLFMTKISQKTIVEANNFEDNEKGTVSDIFMNIESIKLFGKEKNIEARYEKIGLETKEKVVKSWNVFRWQSFGQILIVGFGTFFLMFFTIKDSLNGAITLGTLVFIYTVYIQFIQNLYNFDGGIRNFNRSMADFESLFQYAKVENEIRDKPDATNLKVENGEVEFKNVKFSYNNNPIFENFNLKIPKNKKVAVIGPSGAGKTSLIRLIYRLYDLESGEILIDGKNINSFKQESLRSELSIVPQECVLFDDTIYNNIVFSRPDASREEVMQAMKFAQLDKIVDSFPVKENTIVGERGVKLSGGEKQRVSIARAILANKKILILDEATSSLDSETESEIQKDLHNLMQGRTSIIIAHRLSTIMSADIIVVIEKGKIVQKGSHKELIKKKGLYKKLWNLQKGGYIE